MKKYYISIKLLLFFISFNFISCKEDKSKQDSIKNEKVKPFVAVLPINDVTFHKDSIKEYEYRTGKSGNFKYNYNVFGVDGEGNEIFGNITVHGKYGNGIIFNKNGNKINVNVEWIDHGKLLGIDSDSIQYQLEVSED